jgi:DNA-binding response OmpR family regulator
MAKILLVEDDRDLAGMVIDWLKFEHHLVEAVHDGEDAVNMLKSYQFDVIILDWQLPKLEGVDVLRNYRTGGGQTPVLMLTGKGAIAEKEVGLDAGADDYLTKPFHMKELSARLRALLRRPGNVTGNVLSARDICLEPATFRVTKGGADIQLLPKEFALLEFLMRHPNQVFSADALLDRVWKSESNVSPETVRTCLKRLRRKIDTEEQDSLIQTLHGVGYKLSPS